MDFDRYFTNEELDRTLEEWARDYPGLVRLETIGRSYEDRPIRLMVLTNTDTGPDGDKPALWIDANLHATELAGTTTALRIAHELLSGHGKDDRVTRLLDTCAFYILPRVNPDGAALAMADTPRYVRSSVRVWPWEEKDEGLHEEDVDGDGRLLQMRIPDPNGDWKISSLDPRLLEKRDPHEHGGTYYRLLPEGMLEEFDGYTIKMARPPEGLDFNRNFPFAWRPEDEQSGSGPYPGSEPEIKALMDFIVAHPNINIAISYHTFSAVILRPYGTKADEEMEAEDLWVYKKLADLGSRLTGYRTANTFKDFKYHPKEITTGVFDDWIFDHLGAWAFTVEIWDLPTRAGIEDREFIEWFRDHPHEEDLKVLQWIDENGGEDAYVDWYPFEHPQLGTVELGGWDTLYSWRNPPHAHMGDEAERHPLWILALGDMLPRLTVHTLKVEPLGEGRHHVDLVVENCGYLSTCTSKQGAKRKLVRPVRVELDLPEGVEVLSGKRRSEMGHLEGRSNKFYVMYGASPTDNRARLEWVVEGPKGARVGIRVLSERAGSLKREVVLG